MHVIKFSVQNRNGLWLAGEQIGHTGGPAVVELHGGGQTRQSWGTAARAFAERGYLVLSYDARGHGDSHWDDEGDYHLKRWRKTWLTFSKDRRSQSL